MDYDVLCICDPIRRALHIWTCFTFLTISWKSAFIVFLEVSKLRHRAMLNYSGSLDCQIWGAEQSGSIFNHCVGSCWLDRKHTTTNEKEIFEGILLLYAHAVCWISEGVFYLRGLKYFHSSARVCFINLNTYSSCEEVPYSLHVRNVYTWKFLLGWWLAHLQTWSLDETVKAILWVHLQMPQHFI